MQPDFQSSTQEKFNLNDDSHTFDESYNDKQYRVYDNNRHDKETFKLSPTL